MIHIVHLEQIATERAELLTQYLEEERLIHNIIFAVSYMLTLFTLMALGLPEIFQMFALIIAVERMRSFVFNLHFNAWLYKEAVFSCLFVFVSVKEPSAEEVLFYYERNIGSFKELFRDESFRLLKSISIEAIQKAEKDPDKLLEYKKRYPKIINLLGVQFPCCH